MSSNLFRSSLCSGLLSLLFVFTLSAAAWAQALPAASREPLQVGVAFSFASPDYPPSNPSPNTLFSPTPYVEGFTAFADAGISRRLAAELDLHYNSLITPRDIGEDAYLLGPRYSVALEDRANLYVKVLGGLGRFSYQSGTYANPHTDTYGVVAFGGGIEFRATERFLVRALDLEYQIWPGFPPKAINPIVTSIGAAYRF